MRAHVIAAAFLCLSVQAHSQTATQDITITATVDSACTIDNMASGAVDTATITINADGFVNTAPITPDAAPYPKVACNGPSKLQLTSLNGAVVNGTPVAGFSNLIDYTASAVWNSVTATVNTATLATAVGSESGAEELVGSAFSGNLSVTITPHANTNPLLKGTFTDTLRITLTPQ